MKTMAQVSQTCSLAGWVGSATCGSECAVMPQWSEHLGTVHKPYVHSHALWYGAAAGSKVRIA